MSIYTVKKDENDALFLLDEQGERLSVTRVLTDAGANRVLAFDARMGAGKTTFIKQLCEEMGTDDVVNSPTFAIVNVYDVHNPTLGIDHEQVYHFDCYRLKDIREALDFGAEEYLYSGNWCFIEWPEMIEQILPEDTTYIRINVADDGTRTMTVGE